MTDDTRPAIALVAGRRYVLRSGWITPPLDQTSDEEYPFSTSGGASWTKDGRDLYNREYGQNDIVAEYHEPADQSALQATIRTLEARNIAAMQGWRHVAQERDAANERIEEMKKRYATKCILHADAICERDALAAENKRLCEINTKLDDELARVRDIADARSEILNQQAAKEDTRPTEDELASIWRCAPGTFEAVLVMIKRCGLVREERKS